MKINILLFASYREKTGCSHLELDVEPNSTIRDVKTALIRHFPVLNTGLQNTVASINLVFALDDDLVGEGADIAFFPPVSGGNDFINIKCVTSDPISADNVISMVTKSTTGAVCSFTGIVRGETEGGSFPQTSWLEYESYIPMAEAKLNQIISEIRMRWPEVENIALIQRVGRIDPGVPSVIVACSAAHRDKGIFDAAKYGIDRIKEIVPVWKKEVNPQGNEWVEGDYHPGKGD